ncbi:glutamate synthase (NADPH) GltB1 subunit [Rubrobacter xylanophilus DSM 9941]|uniref:Glutamate synthase (NADPH) GltB1 subunit n=1 Tax=Rubrobacter xylanophilus (strain DSM 9941 / JCM 11954 / NBRC 16129 / PRD-1) TaxID=266117 RepID=Q1AT55_RUBXD|nr:glutamine amidotransferase family protein [Rubrobacter xylanophilus]ABG05423.1 glutamate synthase (NADPH) GltB1 subunit [Rubrobacter xylanophilus DSM 9941]
MCGIVGLLLKDPDKQDFLGEYGTEMLVGMATRGCDSAGLAAYTNEVSEEGVRKFSLYSSSDSIDWNALTKAMREDLDCEIDLKANYNHAVIVPYGPADIVWRWLFENCPEVHILSIGRSIEVYKDVGHPAEIAERYNLRGLSGSHLVGHTRMATESAVTWAHAHPFTVGEDFCLVHNGSLSNPHSLRRMLERKGIHFDTDNDTEAAARFLEWRLREGDDMETALKAAFRELDGFYTLLIGTNNELALVRDAFACKPAVVAENEGYVAIASEFRSLAHLPDVQNADVFEPMPEEIYVWNKQSVVAS